MVLGIHEADWGHKTGKGRGGGWSCDSPLVATPSQKGPVFVWEAQNIPSHIWHKVLMSSLNKFKDFVMWKLALRPSSMKKFLMQIDEMMLLPTLTFRNEMWLFEINDFVPVTTWLFQEVSTGQPVGTCSTSQAAAFALDDRLKACSPVICLRTCCTGSLYKSRKTLSGYRDATRSLFVFFEAPWWIWHLRWKWRSCWCTTTEHEGFLAWPKMSTRPSLCWSATVQINALHSSLSSNVKLFVEKPST